VRLTRHEAEARPRLVEAMVDARALKANTSQTDGLSSRVFPEEKGVPEGVEDYPTSRRSDRYNAVRGTVAHGARC